MSSVDKCERAEVEYEYMVEMTKEADTKNTEATCCHIFSPGNILEIFRNIQWACGILWISDQFKFTVPG